MAAEDTPVRAGRRRVLRADQGHFGERLRGHGRVTAEADGRRQRRVANAGCVAARPAAQQAEAIGADRDFTVERDFGVLNPFAVEEGAVLALKIDDDAAAVAETQLGVGARHPALRIGQHDVIAGATSDLDRPFGQFELALGAVAGNDE